MLEKSIGGWWAWGHDRTPSLLGARLPPRFRTCEVAILLNVNVELYTRESPGQNSGKLGFCDAREVRLKFWPFTFRPLSYSIAAVFRWRGPHSYLIRGMLIGDGAALRTRQADGTAWLTSRLRGLGVAHNTPRYAASPPYAVTNFRP
jgi:hypothetical protein